MHSTRVFRSMNVSAMSVSVCRSVGRTWEFFTGGTISCVYLNFVFSKLWINEGSSKATRQRRNEKMENTAEAETTRLLSVATRVHSVAGFNKNKNHYYYYNVIRAHSIFLPAPDGTARRFTAQILHYGARISREMRNENGTSKNRKLDQMCVLCAYCCKSPGSTGLTFDSCLLLF